MTRKEFLQKAAIGSISMAAASGSGEPLAVYPVPPLARKRDSRRSLDFAENDKILRHLQKHGITNVIYGGNAFLYHLTLREYEQLLDWLTDPAGDAWAIPSVGPSYGRAMDQAALLRGRDRGLLGRTFQGHRADARGVQVYFLRLDFALQDTSAGHFGLEYLDGLDLKPVCAKSRRLARFRSRFT